MQRTQSTIRRIGRYVAEQPLRLISILGLTLLSAGMTLAAPYLLGRALDRYIIPQQFDGFLTICLLLFAVYAVGSLVSWLQAYMLADVAQRTVWQLRRDLFRHLQRLPIPFFVTRTHGELMSRTTNDVENVSTTLNQTLVQMITSLITLVGSFAMMVALNIWLTLVALVTVPLIFFVSKWISGVTKQQFKAQQQHLGRLNSFIEERVSGQKVVALFHQEARTLAQFSEQNEQLRQAGTKAQIYSGLMGPVMNMIGHFGYLLIAGVGGWLTLHDQATVGVIVSFLGYSGQFNRPIRELANQYNLIQSGVAGAERAFEIMDAPSEYGNPAGQTLHSLGSVSGKVEFKDVSFHYAEGKPILKQVSFTADPGQTIALVGPTGAGKTTIVNLIGRFFEHTSGSILIDGKPIELLDRDALRRQIGIVLQDAHLFSGTIADNIRYGKLDATDAQIEAAARQANAHSFISKLPHGYDTQLAAEGGNISHGQRQLITIARAILADPALLVLDEATSSVDTLTELAIQEAMKTLLAGRTSFVIAHRLSTIRGADQILVVQEGGIAERGTHEQLLDRQGLYAELHGKQFQTAATS
ncbi:ATP-binding cassette subfamily B protein [Paenibacillus phyllosphaerae]|uniref:ATP-binding cassette subfamily B protein n=1 Tax=Paenibacillus phyllosphaerae TaxID=274593 RepID=A0A7W5AXW4_9BACL|nr:ABC transporter ATP-binding protein [Paenibacillus phyllosphaerae]MBB3110795.1 ATP-binding cassette subfamily B protein [Paenibacillus phyllosphaerae]